MTAPGGEPFVNETVARFPRGVAAKVVPDAATAGSTCRTVYSRRANGVRASGPRSLAVPKLGDSTAEWNGPCLIR